MKKILCVIICAALTLSLCACGETGTTSTNETENSSVTAAENSAGGGAAIDADDEPSVSGETKTDIPTEETSEQEPESDPEESARDLYEDYLAGNARLYGDEFGITAWFGDAEAPVLSSEQGYTIEELVSRLKECSYTDMASLSEVNSTFIDCGSDGVPELVLQVIFTEEYDTTLTREIIIKEIEGRLQLCYATESYYRYYESLSTTDGLITSGGSNGAMSYSEGCGVIDANGRYHEVYWENAEYHLGSYYPEGSAVQTAASMYSDDISDESLLRIITFYDENGAEETVYCAEPADDELTLKIFKQALTELISADEISRMIDERLAAYGTTYREEALDWTPVDLEAAGLSDIASYGFNPVFVETVDELVNAIGDNVTIILEPGTYNLTEWLDGNNKAVEEYCEQTADSIKGACYTYYNGYEFGIANITGMTIVSRYEDDPALIVSEPRYCHVMRFFECGANLLKDVVVGHTPDFGTCCGDVLAFSGGYNNKIINCDLYGCGAYGICADSGASVTCNDTVIHDCTYGLMEVYGGSYVNFYDCAFKNCQGYTMIYLFESNAYFSNCSFSDLEADMLYLNEDSYVTFGSCMFDAACAEGINSYSGYGTVNVY